MTPLSLTEVSIQPTSLLDGKARELRSRLDSSTGREVLYRRWTRLVDTGDEAAREKILGRTDLRYRCVQGFASGGAGGACCLVTQCSTDRLPAALAQAAAWPGALSVSFSVLPAFLFFSFSASCV